MAFFHVAGTTAGGAPDSIIDWFATFENWIENTVGWAVESGAGSDDLVISSPGEVGTLTKLFVHIWRIPATNTVSMEVRDDLPGTHETANTKKLDSSGIQFNYWMSADLDAIVITWTGYDTLYAGVIVPFALAPADETRHMISAGLYNQGKILQNSAGNWSQWITLYDDGTTSWRRCPYDGLSFPLGARIADRWNTIAGELKHVTGLIGDGSVNLEDVLQTGWPGATTDWIVLADSAGNKFAIRTGGVEPSGVADGAHFASAAGVALSTNDFFTNVLPTFMTAVGWTDLGDHSVPGWDFTRLFYSQGESGVDDIYIHIKHNWAGVNRYIYLMVQDDAIPTHETDGSQYGQMNEAWYPASYLMSADLDCLCFSLQNGAGHHQQWWIGKVATMIPATDGAGKTPYNMLAFCNTPTLTSRNLRARDGTWCLVNGNYSYGSGVINNSNANAYDPLTYLVWPTYLTQTIIGVDRDCIGMMKYMFETNGGGIAQMDTITVGAQVYTVLDKTGAGAFWVMRTT